MLTTMLASDRAELLALYGRRRIGKTHLIRHFVEPKAGTYLEVTGTKDGSAALQRRRFREALESTMTGGQILPDFRSWDDALSYMTQLVERRAASSSDPIVLFFDELPWLATPRSKLLESIDYYWNAHLSRLPQVKLILCGSAASWMLRRLVLAKGGLHNRITRQIRLEPFTLRETHEYLKRARIRLKEMETLELYMALGGVPYYLSLLERGESVAQAVGRLCFERAGPLRGEFDNLFASLYDDHEQHVALVETLATKAGGLTRNELIERLELSSGGGLNRRLAELEEAGFLARISPWGKKVKSTVFRVIDEFSLFHLRWIRPAPKGVLARGAASHWTSRTKTPSYRAWAGYAFESVCLKHARELQRALDIEGLVTDVGSWRHVPRNKAIARQGAQVDLLFDRHDDVIILCEMKFSQEPFVITKSYARELREKITVFEESTKTRKRVVLTLVSPHGLKRNTWSEDLVDRVLDAKALLG